MASLDPTPSVDVGDRSEIVPGSMWGRYLGSTLARFGVCLGRYEVDPIWISGVDPWSACDMGSARWPLHLFHNKLRSGPHGLARQAEQNTTESRRCNKTTNTTKLLDLCERGMFCQAGWGGAPRRCPVRQRLVEHVLRIHEACDESCNFDTQHAPHRAWHMIRVGRN